MTEAKRNGERKAREEGINNGERWGNKGAKEVNRGPSERLPKVLRAISAAVATIG